MIGPVTGLAPSAAEPECAGYDYCHVDACTGSAVGVGQPVTIVSLAA